MKYSGIVFLALVGASLAQLSKGSGLKGAGLKGAGGNAVGCSPLEIVIGMQALSPRVCTFQLQHLTLAIPARATTESAGYGIVCGPLLTAVQKLVPGTTGYAVKYPADFSKSSPDVGVADTIKHINERAAVCPEQKYALSGYSQGAVVMHRAAVKLDKSILKNRIIATATFGDGGQQATKAKPIYDSPVGPIPVWPDELEGKIKFNVSIPTLIVSGSTNT
jgi:Cutinase